MAFTEVSNRNLPGAQGCLGLDNFCPEAFFRKPVLPAKGGVIRKKGGRDNAILHGIMHYKCFSVLACELNHTFLCGGLRIEAVSDQTVDIHALVFHLNHGLKTGVYQFLQETIQLSAVPRLTCRQRIGNVFLVRNFSF